MSKLNFVSPHSLAIKIKQDARVLDLGCAGGYVGEKLKNDKNAFVVGVDCFSIPKNIKLDNFIKCNLEKGLPKDLKTNFDYILLLDVIEHLSDPETFLKKLKEHFKFNPEIKILVSTGNVLFFINRILYFFGFFNYSKRGILDITYKRLFTRSYF